MVVTGWSDSQVEVVTEQNWLGTAAGSWSVFSRSPSSGGVRRDFRAPKPATYSEERGLFNNSTGSSYLKLVALIG